MLRETGGILGGETSGHILCLDKTTTGDGLVSALQVLAVMKQTGPLAGRARLRHAQVPAGAAQREGRQALRSRRACRPCSEAVQRIEQRMAGDGRVVLRASGTEPVIRVMVEGRDESGHAGRAPPSWPRSCAPPPAEAAAPRRTGPAIIAPASGCVSRLRRYHRAPLNSQAQVAHAPPDRRRKLENARVARRERARSSRSCCALSRRSGRGLRGLPAVCVSAGSRRGCCADAPHRASAPRTCAPTRRALHRRGLGGDAARTSAAST